MEIDVMILKANKDGNFYINTHDGYEYQKEIGFVGPKGQGKLTVQQSFWEEKPKRCISIQEAEKALDCLIDINCKNLPLRSPNNPPDKYRNVVVLLEISKDSSYTGYYSSSGSWYTIGEECSTQIPEPLCWIDPDDIFKLLPKQG